jgi:O-antigen ligase
VTWSWGRSAVRVRLMNAAWLAVAAGALMVGLWSVGISSASLLPFVPVRLEDARVLPLPGVMGHPVNENVLGAVGAMALPMALSLARTSWAAAVVAVTAVLAIWLSQSLSVWAACVGVALAAMAWRGGWRGGILSGVLAAAALTAVLLGLTVEAPTVDVSLAPPAAPALTGAMLVPTVRTVPGTEHVALRLTEDHSTGRHGIATTFDYVPGLAVLTTLVHVDGRPFVWMSGPLDVARYDLSTGTVNDLGSCSGWIEPFRDDWVAIRQIVTARGGRAPLNLFLLDRFPEGLTYRGDGQTGLNIYGPLVQSPRTVVDAVRMAGVKMRTSVCRSTVGRRHVWSAGLAYWRNAPWFGAGLDMFRYHYARDYMSATDHRERRSPPHAHNVLLQIAIDTGLIGIVGYLWLLGVVMARCLSQGRAPEALLALLAVHLFGVVDAVPLGAKVGILVWGAMGLALAATRTEPSDPVRPR